MATGARRPAARARADGGPARRRRGTDPVHGHLHDRPRAAGQPGDLARGVVPRAPAGRRADLGRPGAGLAVRAGRRAARDRAEAVPRPRVRAARPLPVRCCVRPPRAARRTVGLSRPGRPPENAAAGAPPPAAARDRSAGRTRLPRARCAHPAVHALRRQRRDARDGRDAPVVLRLDGLARDSRPARGGRGGSVARRSRRRARCVIRRRLLRLARHRRRPDRRWLRDTALAQPGAVRLDGRVDVLAARLSAADRAGRDRGPRRRARRRGRQGTPAPQAGARSCSRRAPPPSGASAKPPRATASRRARPRTDRPPAPHARARRPS